VTTIGRYAFAFCTSLETITIPPSVTSIGDFAFDGCTSLVPFDISNVTNVGHDIFNGCKTSSTIKKGGAKTGLKNNK
jgi:hypothetical protein